MFIDKKEEHLVNAQAVGKGFLEERVAREISKTREERPQGSGNVPRGPLATMAGYV